MEQADDLVSGTEPSFYPQLLFLPGLIQRAEKRPKPLVAGVQARIELSTSGVDHHIRGRGRDNAFHIAAIPGLQSRHRDYYVLLRHRACSISQGPCAAAESGRSRRSPHHPREHVRRRRRGLWRG